MNAPGGAGAVVTLLVVLCSLAAVFFLMFFGKLKVTDLVSAGKFKIVATIVS